MNQPANSTDQTASLWTYPHGLGRTVVADLIGYQVVASDGEIGHIDQTTDEIEASAVVVDTGHWIFGKQRMIPVGVIDRIDAQARTVHVRLSKDQIRHAPDFVERPVDHADHADHDVHREDLVAYYSRWWG